MYALTLPLCVMSFACVLESLSLTAIVYITFTGLHSIITNAVACFKPGDKWLRDQPLLILQTAVNDLSVQKVIFAVL